MLPLCDPWAAFVQRELESMTVHANRRTDQRSIDPKTWTLGATIAMRWTEFGSLNSTLHRTATMPFADEHSRNGQREMRLILSNADAI